MAAMMAVTTTTQVYGADAAGMTNQRDKRNVAVFIKLLRLTGLGQKLGLNSGSGSAYKYGPNYGPRGLALVNPAAYGVAPGAVYSSFETGYAGAGYGPVPTAGVSFGPLPAVGQWDGLAPVVVPSPDASWPVNSPTAVVYAPSPVHRTDVGGYD